MQTFVDPAKRCGAGMPVRSSTDLYPDGRFSRVSSLSAVAVYDIDMPRAFARGLKARQVSVVGCHYSPMSLLTAHSSAFLVAIPAVLVLALAWTWRRSNARRPPGPRGLPLVGNLFDMPKSHEWLQYAEWSRQYST